MFTLTNICSQSDMLPILAHEVNLQDVRLKDVSILFSTELLQVNDKVAAILHIVVHSRATSVGVKLPISSSCVTARPQHMRNSKFCAIPHVFEDNLPALWDSDGQCSDSFVCVDEPSVFVEDFESRHLRSAGTLLMKSWIVC